MQRPPRRRSVPRAVLLALAALSWVPWARAQDGTTAPPLPASGPVPGVAAKPAPHRAASPPVGDGSALDAAAVQAKVKAKRARRYPFSFGMLLGHPPGLQVQARLLPAHAVVAQVSYDPWFRGMTATADYRLSFLDWEFIRYDAVLEVWAGVGARVSFLEPRFGTLPTDLRRTYQRDLPVAPGVHIPVGATVKLSGLPMELGLNATLLGFDVYQLALHVPRWRPTVGLETRVYLPVQL